MPLTRYFLVVGGALLALLFVVSACLPTLPLAEKANSNRVVIRIHSVPKWPERVDYDVSLLTSIPQQTANTESIAPNPATTAVDVPAGAREAFAQLHPSDAVQLAPSDTRRREVKLQRQHKPPRKRAAPREFVMARQPHFGWFGYGTW